jgi:hypothetical protein
VSNELDIGTIRLFKECLFVDGQAWWFLVPWLVLDRVLPNANLICGQHTRISRRALQQLVRAVLTLRVLVVATAASVLDLICHEHRLLRILLRALPVDLSESPILLHLKCLSILLCVVDLLK